MFFRKKIKPQIMITIPEPCSETWSEMRVVDDCHRHCAACDRTLTDFAQMSDDELLIFFKHAQGKICGRFRQDQLNRPLTPLPEQTSHANWWKAAALLPLALFSKNGSAQQLSPDTTLTEQEAPGITLDTSAAPVHVVDWKPTTDSLNFNWNWRDMGDGRPDIIVTGGVPMIIPLFDFPPTCVTATIDSAKTLLPKTQSEVGLKEALPVAPKKKSDGPRSAQAGWSFQAIIPDTTKNK